nr:bifunctional DNA-formamidopyrimidine glycosylase/DNA-(apurinic or apyrimidinic site) lyase [Anaerolineae bacterium]
MPELPEVETVVRGLHPLLRGRIIWSAQVYWAGTVADLPAPDFEERIAGQQIKEIGRRGKYIVLDLSNDSLLIHLKMTGRLYIAGAGQDSGEDRWMRVVFALDNGKELRFSDLRKFGRVYLTSTPGKYLDKLGPEPLYDSFTPEVFCERLAGRAGQIKPLLMNQAIVAGIGNIYADEALWYAGIDPRRKADTLTQEEQDTLYRSVRKVLSDGIEREGASVNWYRKPDGSTGSAQEYFKAYGQSDKPCPRCGTPIRKIRLAQRGTHFCPLCQQ